MPSDDTLPQTPSIHHGNGNAPYPCHEWPEPPAAQWAIDYGYCRTSLDEQPPHYRQGSADPRCPRDCPHKAPQRVAKQFTIQFIKNGARSAAAWARNYKEAHKS